MEGFQDLILKKSITAGQNPVPPGACDTGETRCVLSGSLTFAPGRTQGGGRQGGGLGRGAFRGGAGPKETNKMNEGIGAVHESDMLPLQELNNSKDAHEPAVASRRERPVLQFRCIEVS